MTLFDDNLRALRSTDPVLADRVERGGEDAPVALQKSQTGMPIAIVEMNGQAYALHHPQDPVQHAQELISRAQGIHEAQNLILLGCGLGYTPLLLLQVRSAWQHIYILEPSLSVFRKAQQAFDFSALFQHPAVRFIVGQEPGLVYQGVMGHLMDLMANPVLMMDNPPITAAFPEWAAQARQEIQEAMRLGQSGLHTKFRDGPLTLSNLTHNLEAIFNSPGIKDVGTLCRNVPAIIVAAGPSLIKNIDLLKQAQRHFLIIACDTAYNTLVNRDIIPHLVVTVDPTELNLRHFPAERYGHDSFLLFDPECRPEIVEKFPHRLTYMTDKHPFFNWLDREMGGKGIIPKGGMVSQAGMQAAFYLGCSPVILVGQDLALDLETCTTHADGTALCRKVTFSQEKEDFVEISVPDRQETTLERIFWVEGVNGEKVPTTQNFLVYINMLQEDIRREGVRVIDATEGGAKIAGTVIQTLEETLKREQKEKINLSEIMTELLEKFIHWRPHKTPRIRQNLRTLMQRKRALALQGLKYLEGHPQARLEDLSAQMERSRQQIFSDPVSEYLIEYAAPQELFDFLKLGPANASIEDQRETLRRRFLALLKATEYAEVRLNPIF